MRVFIFSLRFRCQDTNVDDTQIGKATSSCTDVVISVETCKRMEVLQLDLPTAGEPQIYKLLSAHNVQMCGTELNRVVRDYRLRPRSR